MSELENMDEEVLKAISAFLEPKHYTIGTQMIKEKDELHMMFFVTRGTVGVRRSSRKMGKLFRDGQVYGNELLVWALDTLTTSPFPLSAGTATADSDVDVLILNETDLVNVLHAATQVPLIISDTGSPPTTDSESEY